MWQTSGQYYIQCENLKAFLLKSGMRKLFTITNHIQLSSWILRVIRQKKGIKGDD
jgi:hypothetical protein